MPEPIKWEKVRTKQVSPWEKLKVNRWLWEDVPDVSQSTYEANSLFLKEYYNRLNIQLKYMVEVGEFEQSQAMQILQDTSDKIQDYYNRAANNVGGARYMPFTVTKEDLARNPNAVSVLGTLQPPLWEDVMAYDPISWQSLVTTQTKEVAKIQYKKQSAKTEYLPALQNYLKGANVKGDKADAILKEANDLIDLGIEVNRLPNAESVNKYTQAQKREKQAIGMANVESAEWKREYETTIKPRLDLLASMQAEEDPTRHKWLMEIEQDQQMARQWESQRDEAIKSITDPRGWLVKQQLQNMPNPYEASFLALSGGVSASDLRPGIQSAQIPDIVKKFAPGVASTYQTGQYAPIERKGISENPLTKVPIQTPSGQAWAGLLPSEKETLAGYADYQGTYWPDVEAKMRQMLPYNPGGGSRWQPARSRV